MCKTKIVFHSENICFKFFYSKVIEIACTNGGIPLIFICCIAGSQVSL